MHINKTLTKENWKQIIIPETKNAIASSQLDN
jgi:hypothetical protein